MDMKQAVVLGLVQGATEYIPVSSKTHLILVPYWLGWPEPSMPFNILIQLGTLIGVFIYFWRDLMTIARAVVAGLIARKPFETQEARTGWYVVVATLPAVFFGLTLKHTLEPLYKEPRLAMGMLLITAAWLLLAEQLSSQKRGDADIRLKDGVVIGFAQACALLPGISRSGSTIATGMLLGLNRAAAARFSFLMSIPVMLGASVLGLKDLLKSDALVAGEGQAIVVGALVAGVSGYVVIRWLLDFVKHRPLSWFAAYCIVVGAGGLLVDILIKSPPPG